MLHCASPPTSSSLSPPQPLPLSIYSLSIMLYVLYPNCFASLSASPSICMHPHSPPSLCTSIMLSMNVLLPALIFLRLYFSPACTRLLLSIYIYNAVYVLLPIMLSISVFLLLAGWKGVRGGLSQLIYHIKYQPSSTFSLPLFLVHPFTRLPLLSLLSSSLPFLHLLPFTSLLLTCPLHFFFFLSLVSPPLSPLSHSLTLFPLSPPALFWRFPSLSLFLTNAICLCGQPPTPSVMTLGPYLSRFPSLSCTQTCTLPLSCQIWCDLQRYNMPDNTKETQSCKKISLPNHNNGFWQCSTLIFWR